MLNKCVLIGRLTKDPESRYTQSGIAVTTFRLAVNRTFSNSQGEREADFIPVQTWRTLAENCTKYLSKGRLVAVSGRIQTRSYDQDGQKRYTWELVADEVQFLERGQKQSTAPATQDTPEGFDPVGDDDDELPF